MSTSEPEPNPPLTYTLEPLRSDGPDALTPEPSDGILSVRLRQIELSWKDSLHETIIKSSDDLFEPCTRDSDADPIPLGPALTRAIIEFQFADSPHPHCVEIHPPKTLKCERAADTNRITTFLLKHRFLQALNTGPTPLSLLLTATVAAILSTTS